MEVMIFEKILTVCGVLALGALPSFANYSAVNDFPTLNVNPNGVWSYGYSNSATTGFTIFPSGDFVSSTGSVGYETPGTPFNVPLIVRLTGSPTLLEHPGEFGLYAIVRFTVPATGVYSYNATFVGTDPGAVTYGDGTDVHVVSPAFTEQSGISNYNSPVNFQGTNISLGYNTNWSYDTTSFSATVTPEPSFYGILALGLTGLAGAFRRRKRASI
jgi:MYXO-CTERM domain-containing protein